MSSELLESALAYCEAGFSVLPWNYVFREGTPNKVPNRIWQGARTWKTDVVPKMVEAEIRAHWRAYPDDNVGIATGRVSGVVVLDADDDAASAWVRANLPTTPWRISTGRGVHFGYRAPTFDIKTAAKLGCREPRRRADEAAWTAADHRAKCAEGGACCHLDVRGYGGFVGMPPSAHHTGRVYEWAGEEFGLEDLPVFDPSWVTGLKALEREHVATTGSSEDRDDAPAAVFENARAWMRQMPPAISGNQGRNATFRVAAGLVRDFALSKSQALALMEEYNRTAEPPWASWELQGKVDDAWKKGTHDVGRKRTEGVLDGLADLDNRAAARTAPSPPQVPFPAQTPSSAAAASPPSVTETEDKAFLDEALAAASGGNPGHLFRPEVLTRLASVWKTNAPLFHNFRADAKRIGGLDIRDLVKAVKNKQAEISRLATAGTSLGSEEGDRARVVIQGDEKKLRDGIIDALLKHSGIFTVTGKLSFLNTKDSAMSELRGGALRNVLVNICDFVKTSTEDDGSVTEVAASLPQPMLQMLENLLPEQAKKFREVDRVTAAPFFTPDGELVQHPGYSDAAKTLLIADSPLNLEGFASVDAAVSYIRNIFKDFEWASDAEFANYFGALLVPMVRSMYKGATPFLLIEANVQGAGKSLLADCVQLLYGYDEIKHTTLPVTEEAIAKQMLSTLSEGRTIIIFDNLRRALDSPTLEDIATSSGYFQSRILGRSEDRSVPVQQLFVLTSNNMQTTVDAARRMIRVRLCKTAALSVDVDADRKYEIEDLPAFVRENRLRMLAALATVVRAWLEADRPLGTRVLPSYEAFSRVIGSLVQFAGMPDWLSNFTDTRAGLTSNDDFDAFAVAWWDTYKKGADTTQKLTAGKVYEVAVKHQLLGSIFAGGPTDEHGKVSRFGSYLAQRRDSIIGDFQVCVGKNDKQKAVYWLRRLAPAVPDATQEDAPATTVH